MLKSRTIYDASKKIDQRAQLWPPILIKWHFMIIKVCSSWVYLTFFLQNKIYFLKFPLGKTCYHHFILIVSRSFERSCNFYFQEIIFTQSFWRKTVSSKHWAEVACKFHKGLSKRSNSNCKSHICETSYWLCLELLFSELTSQRQKEYYHGSMK